MAEKNAGKDQKDDVINLIQSTLIGSYLAHREKLNIVKRREETKGNMVYRSRTGKEEQVTQLLVRRFKLDRYFESLYSVVYPKPPEELPSYDEINGKPLLQVNSLLSANIKQFEKVIEKIGNRFNTARVVKGNVELSEGYYNKFLNWYTDYYEIGQKGEELKEELLKADVEFSLNGASDYNQVVSAIYVEYMTLIESLKEEQKNEERVLLSPEISEFISLSDMLEERRLLLAYGPQLKEMTAKNYKDYETIVKQLLRHTQNVNKTKELLFKMVDLKSRTNKKVIRDWLPTIWNTIVQEAINEYIQAQQKAQESETKDLDEGIDEEKDK